MRKTGCDNDSKRGRENKGKNVRIQVNFTKCHRKRQNITIFVYVCMSDPMPCQTDINLLYVDINIFIPSLFIEGKVSLMKLIFYKMFKTKSVLFFFVVCVCWYLNY